MRALSNLHKFSEVINEINFISLLDLDYSAKMIDLGCGNGEFTLRCTNKVETQKIWGVEISLPEIEKSQEKGIKIIQSDLNKSLPFKDNFFDIVISNQVLEHLLDIDQFFMEIYRILKINGYAILSTENLSSWHNIFALIMGFRPFSLDYSNTKKIGNPFSPHHNTNIKSKPLLHNKVLSYFSLKEMCSLYKFKIDKILGGGYYPMPFQSLSMVFSKIDPIHSHFLTIKIRK